MQPSKSGGFGEPAVNMLPGSHSDSRQSEVDLSAPRHRMPKERTLLVGDIKNALSRINWLIIGGIITGVVGFLIRGGFSP